MLLGKREQEHEMTETRVLAHFVPCPCLGHSGNVKSEMLVKEVLMGATQSPEGSRRAAGLTPGISLVL